MSGFFSFDIETLGTTSECVILSAALVYVDIQKTKQLSNEELYKYLINESIFVKFNVKEQIEHNRTTSKSTIDWWKQQDKDIQNVSLLPRKDDVLVVDGLNRLRDYVKENGSNSSPVYIRGNLDGICIDSLAESFKVEPICHWGRYRDFRTAIDLFYGTSNGYVEVPEFDKNLVKKHNPIHDIVYDSVMFLRGELNE
jgi:hypothetical protein